MKKKLLIINQRQFGYHIDTYYYCKYLKNHFDITYLGYDAGQKKVKLDGIKVLYIPRKGNPFAREAKFFLKTAQIINRGFDLHFLKYYKGCCLLEVIFSKKEFILDIRSASVLKKRLYRSLYDQLMKFEVRFFNNVSIISESLAKRLKLKKGYIQLPLGADIISNMSKDMNRMDLLYVGTLYNRRIEDTILGFAKFFLDYRKKMEMTYTIIGTGLRDEEEELKSMVEKMGLSRHVRVLGSIPHDRLKPYFDRHNIGVSYVPVTDYYNAQPPTKNYEYLLSGMPVIATETFENKRVVNRGNGCPDKRFALRFL